MAQLSGLLLVALASAFDAAGSEAPIDVRIGIVAYQNLRANEFDEIQGRLKKLQQDSPRPINIRPAIGTYGDVMHWMDRKYIDLAVLSPGILAEKLKTDAEKPEWEYLGTIGLHQTASGAAADEARPTGYRYEYNAICVVAARSKLQDIEDVRREAKLGRVRFLFVHPLSVSGRIAPELALHQVGISPKDDDVEYTYTHSNSLTTVTEPIEGKERVAFVFDDEPPDPKSPIRVLAFPELESLVIPGDAVVARRDFEYAGLVAALLKQHVDADGRHDFERFENWRERYGVVNDWSQKIRLPNEPQDRQRISLEEVGRILQHGAHSQPPRIALVLSGGGAKCAYQLGAVRAIEEKLAELRSKQDDPSLDIGLVVGTSGGAINALPIALGITATKEGREDFEGVWESLDQQEIVRPSKLVRWNMGLWFVSIQASIVLWLVRSRVADPKRRGPLIAKTFVALAIPQILLALIRWTPWRLLGTNHILHHAWLWAMFGVGWSGWCMLLLGAASLAAGWWLGKRGKHLEGPPRLVRWLLIVGLIGLPGLQLATVFFHENTLTDGTGIEHALADKLPLLVNRQCSRTGKPSIELDPTLSDAGKLRRLSQQIIERRLLRRDLVLTASCLSKTAGDLPSDLYFYASASADPNHEPKLYGNLGKRLAAYPESLVDVVMGSGSIFPVFPARTLSDFPEKGNSVELIDGGFAHNSPIEAAWLWDATHIILIEASPDGTVRDPRSNFLQNSIDAFNHLYYQAQLADSRSKEKITIFTLRPRPPHICVLDFANNLVDAAIKAGYREARGEIGSGSTPSQDRPSWEKGLGEPVFLEVR